jgi:MFS family permease
MRGGFLRPYREIFRVPGAWRFCVAGIIGRMPISMYGLGTVLLISAGTGRYDIAGSVSAVSSLGLAVSAPQLARFVDTRGQRAVLVPLVTVFTLSVAALVACVEFSAPLWTLFAAGIAAGATMPVLGPMARARWSALLAGSPRLHTAFSVESVADELCFVVGPAMVTLLSTGVDPAAGIGVCALLCLAGTLWFAAQRATQPSPTGVPGSRRQGSRGQSSRGQGSASGELAPAEGPRPLLAARGLAVLVPVYVCLGAMFVAIDLSTVAFATDFGHKPLAGMILGIYAAGSATGGLWYGSRHWRAPAWLRFLITLCVTVGGVCTFWAMPDMLMLAVVIYLCGLTIAPTIIAGYSLLEEQALPGRRTESMSWLSTGISVGVASGSTVAGFILDSFGARWGYAFAGGCGLLAAVVCLAGLRWLRGGTPLPVLPLAADAGPA